MGFDLDREGAPVEDFASDLRRRQKFKELSRDKDWLKFEIGIEPQDLPKEAQRPFAVLAKTIGSQTTSGQKQYVVLMVLWERNKWEQRIFDQCWVRKNKHGKFYEIVACS